MNLPLSGIFILILSSLFFCLSLLLLYKKRGNYILGLILIIAGGVVLRIYCASDPFLHTWDERYHALVAKNLIHHPLKPTLYDNPLLPYDYKNWNSNHIWLAKPPVPLWFISLSIRIFGFYEIALRIPSIIVSTIAIFLTFLIANLLFNKQVAFLAAFLHAINGLLIELSAGRVSSDHIETFFIFFVELAILFSILSIMKKRKLWIMLAGISMGMAFLSKWMPALIVLPVYCSLAIYSKKISTRNLYSNLLLLILFFLITSFPWLIYTLINYPKEWKMMVESLFVPIGTIIQEHSGPPWYYLNNIRITFGEIVYIPIVWYLWKAYKTKRLRPISIWFLVALIVFSISETKRLTYMLIAAPAIFMMTSYFFIYAYSIRNKIRYRWLIWVILVLLIALPIRYSIERVKPFEENLSEAKEANLYRSFKSINLNSKCVVFNVENPIEAMFYSDCIAYPQVPSEEELTLVINKGYKAFELVTDTLMPIGRESPMNYIYIKNERASLVK